MKTVSIPSYICGWTDKYFHQSAFDTPVNHPSKRTVVFLGRFKKPNKVTLYRGIHIYNRDNKGVTSWTYDKRVAKRYAKEEEGKVIEREFLSEQILLDTTVLNEREKEQLGYDYKIDDKEVLILEK